MNRFAHALIHTGSNKEKENMIWNMIGSFCYAFASMVLAFLVMRMVGEEEGGIFGFGFSTFGQQMFIVAYFGIRPFQVTDGKNQYSFGDYLRHRILTCLAAVSIGIIYLVFQMMSGSYTLEKSAVIFLLVLYKVVDGLADVYESEFQRNGNLHLTGKSNTFRTILSVSCFLLSLAVSGSLLWSCAVAVAAQAVGFCLFDAYIIRFLDGIDAGQGKGQTPALFRSTSLLFISAFLDFYIFSAAKYAIDSNLSDAYSGYFNIIFMPTSVINLVAGFVIRPFLISLTEFWNGKRLDDFKRQFGKLFFIILALTVIAVAGTWLIGKPVLGILEQLLGSQYRGKLTVYHGSFVLIVLGGGFYAVLSLMYYSLVIMRKQLPIFAAYGVSALAAAALSNMLVRRYEVLGAAMAYLCTMIVLAAAFGFLTWFSYQKEKKQNG